MFNRRNSDRLGNCFQFRWTIRLTDPLLFSIYLFILPEKLARVQFPSMTSSFFRPDLNFENTSEREQEVCMCAYMHMFDSYTNCYLKSQPNRYAKQLKHVVEVQWGKKVFSQPTAQLCKFSHLKR